MLKSLFNIQKTIAQTPLKQIAKTIFDPGIFLNVCCHNLYKTYVIISKGPTVNIVLTILYIVAALPVIIRCTLSLANNTRDDAPCSNDIQKNTVKNANMMKASILSLTTLVYLNIREIAIIRKATKATIIITYDPPKPPISKGKRLVPPILDIGSLIKYAKPITLDTAISILSSIVKGLAGSSSGLSLDVALFSLIF